jgi:hypothetical protein
VSESDPRRYEEECLEWLLRYYSNPAAQETMVAFAGRRFLGARLEGGFPDTALVVSLGYGAGRSDSEVRYRLWVDDWVDEGPNGERHRMSPSALIDILTVDLDSPGEPKGS